MRMICNADKDATLRFTVQSFRVNGNHQLYGSCETTVRRLMEGERWYQLANGSGGSAGILSFNEFEMIERPSFMEYLRSGWMCKLSTSIDFTQSNGE